METPENKRLQAIVTRAYVADPEATESDLKSLAVQESQLSWLYMLGTAKEDAPVEELKNKLPKSVAKVRARPIRT